MGKHADDNQQTRDKRRHLETGDHVAADRAPAALGSAKQNDTECKDKEIGGDEADRRIQQRTLAEDRSDDGESDKTAVTKGDDKSLTALGILWRTNEHTDDARDDERKHEKRHHAEKYLGELSPTWKF